MRVLAYEGEVGDILGKLLSLAERSNLLSDCLVIVFNVLNDLAHDSKLLFKLRDDQGDNHSVFSINAGSRVV